MVEGAMHRWKKSFAWIVLLAAFSVNGLGAGYAENAWSSSYAGIPRSDKLDNTIIVLLNEGFIIGYSDERMNPLWVSYRVYDADFSTAAGSKGWRIDWRTSSYVNTGDYKYIGYDRGHMAPNATIKHCYGEEAQRQTYLMSNVSPQLHVMNDGPWGDLEQWVRDNVGRFREVWVITGPIFDDINGHQYLKKSVPHANDPQKDVEIPEEFYKVIIDETKDSLRVLAFIIPQTAERSAHSVDFLTSVDEIEELTGFDFFWQLEDAVENTLEAREEKALW